MALAYSISLLLARTGIRKVERVLRIMTTMDKIPNFTDELDTIYEYENEGDLVPSRILHVLSKPQPSIEDSPKLPPIKQQDETSER